MEIEKLTGIVLDICIKIHTKVGPGCFEKVYEEILYHELFKRQLYIERQVLMPILYDDLLINDAYRIDILVEDKLILEIKSVEKVVPVHFKQLRTYLNLMQLKNGILLNFHVEWMKFGFHRVFNNVGF